MAVASPELIGILRATAKRLHDSTNYQWGHMGACNCGHLAQEITKLSKAEIHEIALSGHGDWSTQIREYCPDSGMPMHWIMGELLALGLSTRDIENLEYLADDKVLKLMPADRRHPQRNNKADVVLYLEKWADLLAAELAVSALKQEMNVIAALESKIFDSQD